MEILEGGYSMMVLTLLLKVSFGIKESWEFFREESKEIQVKFNLLLVKIIVSNIDAPTQPSLCIPNHLKLIVANEKLGSPF